MGWIGVSGEDIVRTRIIFASMRETVLSSFSHRRVHPLIHDHEENPGKNFSMVFEMMELK
jgi:hypothetical protein